MSNVQQNHFMSVFMKEVNNHSCYREYKILPEFGSGELNILNILDGLELIFSDIKILPKLKRNMGKEVNSRFLKIEYCLEGEYNCFSQFETDFLVKKNKTAYYFAKNKSVTVDFFQKKYKAVILIVSLDDIAESMERLHLNLRSKIDYYYEKQISRDKYLVVDTAPEILLLLQEMKTLKNKKEFDLLKIKTLELLCKEIKLFEQFESRAEYYYSGEIFNKTKAVKCFVEKNYIKHYSIQELSDLFSISSADLKRTFKYLYGMGPFAYLQRIRMQQAEILLRETDHNILEIADSIGYSNPSKFSQTFKKHFSLSPSVYRKKISKISNWSIL